MASSGSTRRLEDALPGETGIWGRSKRVVVGPEPGVEVARICADCHEECRHKRTKFVQLHGEHADGSRKCPLRQQQPADAHTGAPQLPAAAAAGGQPDTDEQSDGMQGADAVEVELPAWELPECPPEPSQGDIWHDSAEEAEWLTEEEDADQGASMHYSDSAAAAAAFADACSLYDSLCSGQQLSPKARADLAQQMGDVLVEGLETRQQPEALGAQGVRLPGRGQPDLDALSALLGEDIGLAPEQLQELHSRLQQQLAEQREAMEEEESEEAAEEGVFFDSAAEGVQYSMEEEGVAFEYDAAQDAASSSTSKQHFEALMSSPLWRCQGEMAQVQLYQAIFLLMAWKMDYVVRDAAFIALLGILGKLLLPKAHNLPSSLYMFKQLLGVRDIADIERHSCEMGCTGWPPTPRKQWQTCKDDKCYKCGGKRFKTVMGRLAPVRRFWFVPLDDSITELMSDPNFVTALQSPRVARVGNYWDSLEYRRLNRAVGGVLDNPQHGVLEIGFDFAEPYNFAKHSTGLMFMRYASLPNGASAKREWHKLVMAIEGPTEPTYMDAFLEPLVESLRRLAPPQPAAPQPFQPQPSFSSEVSAGIQVQPTLRDEQGQLAKGEPFTHFAVLGAVYADSPARAKLMYTLASWTAYLACAFCKLTGTMKNKVVRFLGYAEPTPTTQGVGRGKSYQMGQPDGRVMTAREVKAQAIAAEYYRARGFEPPPGNRFKGFSPLLRRLYYVNPVRLWVIPFCHAFYLGVFKDFMKLVTAKKSKAGDEAEVNPFRMPDAERRVVRGRLGGLQLHPSFNRKFRDPFGSLASWQIDDCARAVQCFLPMLLRPARSGQRELPLLRPEVAKKAFGHLKRCTAFHLGHVQFDSVEEYRAAAKAAVQELIDYGALMEKELPSASTCTYNLHLLTCQLYLQCVERGITHELFELWVERLIGEFKQRVKYRTRAEPEKTMVGDDMVKRALQRWRVQYPEVFTWQEHAGQGEQLHAGTADLVGAAGAVLGRAQNVTAATFSEELQRSMQRAVQHNVEDVGLRQLWLDNWGQLGALVYKEALLPGGSYITSRSYTRSRTRDGSFVLVPFTGPQDDAVKHCPARVSHFVQLTLPHSCSMQLLDQQPPVLLFAVCDLLPHLQPFEDADICGYDSIILFGRDKGNRAATFAHLDYPVLLSNVHSPLLRQDYQGQDGLTWWAFVPINFRTGGRRHL